MPPKAKGFWYYVEAGEPDVCWPFIGGRNHQGYGLYGTGANKRGAHREAYILTFGPIPDGMVVMHKCDNPSCCNPNHLEIGTVADNTRDHHTKNGGMTLEKANAIRLEHGLGNTSYRTLAFMYGVTPSAIGKIVRNERWSNVTHS